MEFEWDMVKAAGNLHKHGVSFQEAASVVGDFLGATVADPDHSVGVDRFITIRLSNRGRLLMVAHAQRLDRVRIISARTLSRGEKRAYEETR
jgi:uncharacterized DUF497 family protein